MKPVITHPEAGEEYTQAVQTYEQKRPGLGSRFYEEIKRLVSEILNNPSTFRYFKAPYRRHFSNTFPYAVIYEEKPDYIHIVAIAHMHRRPNYWMHRTGRPTEASATYSNTGTLDEIKQRNPELLEFIPAE